MVEIGIGKVWMRKKGSERSIDEEKKKREELRNRYEKEEALKES